MAEQKSDLILFQSILVTNPETNLVFDLTVKQRNLNYLHSNGLFHFKSIQAYGSHFLLTFCTPEIQGDRMNFSPGKLDYCYEHSGILGMFLDDPGFQGVLHNDPGFPGVSVQRP